MEWGDLEIVLDLRDACATQNYDGERLPYSGEGMLAAETGRQAACAPQS
jgi:hypothetical protein